jgi:nucleotide-binding universal stress UspA family protein
MSKDLLVPLDGSPLAERVLPYATGLARALDARVILVYAWWPVIPEADGPDLEAVAARLRADGVAAETYVCHLPSLGEAAKAIARPPSAWRAASSRWRPTVVAAWGG